MNPGKRDSFGILGIAGLIAAGIWYAQDPEILGQLLSVNAAGTGSRPLPQMRAKRVNWSSDGRVLLSLARGEQGAELFVSRRDAIEKSHRLPIDWGDDPLSSATLAPDGRHAIVATFGGRLLWIDLQSTDLILLDKLPLRGYFSATAVGADGRLRAGGTDAGSIILFDPIRYTSTRLDCPHNSTISYLAFSRDETRLVSAQNNGRIGLWNVATGELLQEFQGHRFRATAAMLLPDGKRIISSGIDDTVRIWDVATRQEQWHGEFDLSGVTTLTVSEDGTKAAWGGHKCKIIVWDLERGQKDFEINTSASTISHLSFSADGTSLAAAENDEMIHLYDSQTGMEQERITLDD